MQPDDRDWGLPLWKGLLGGAAGTWPDGDPPPALVARAQVVAPPALVVEALGARADAASVRNAAELVQYCRYVLSRQLQAMQWLQEAGIATVAMKGLAAALSQWRDPEQRIVGDLDLLVQRQDLPAIVALFSRHGFRFGGVRKSRWGFLSDASFLPFHSPDGICNIDLHVEADSYPLHRGLGAEEVFAAARFVQRNGLRLSIPAAEHSLLIAVANLAKDKFELGGARKLIDIARLVDGQSLDWRQIERRARAARLGLPLRTALSLAIALGMPAECVPPSWRMPPAGLRHAAWRALRDGWLGFDDRPASLGTLLAREWLLAADPAVAGRLALRRLRGLVAPRSGLPQAAGNSAPP